MTLLEVQQELSRIHNLLEVKTGHSMEQAQRMLEKLQSGVVEEAQRRKEFEEWVISLIHHKY